MLIDFSQINTGVQPDLRLRTMHGQEFGVIPYVFDLSFELNYADTSTINFSVAAQSDGKLNPVYDKITGYTLVYTKHYGIYVLMSPKRSGDGVREIKTVQGYSIEKLLERKTLYLEEGTYNFWDPVNPSDTVLGRILELDSRWKCGYVAPGLIGEYRTFDEINNNPLSFCYGDAAEKYQCVFVFDVYRMEINVYDAGADLSTVPVYLAYDNLVKEADVEELSDDVVTRLHVYGADDLTIYDVNPLGKDYIIDLSWFIANGSIRPNLAKRVRGWQQAIEKSRSEYTGLVSSRSLRTARKLSETAALGDLNGELEVLTAQQSVVIQSIAEDKSQQGQLDEINGKIQIQKEKISQKEAEVKELEGEIKSLQERIKSFADGFDFEHYFTPEEQSVLNCYMIDGTITEESFVASSDVDVSASGHRYDLSEVGAEIAGSAVSMIAPDGVGTIYTFSGGVISVGTISGNVVRGTLELDPDGAHYLMAVHLGSGSNGEKKIRNASLTLYGTLSQFTSDVSEHNTGRLVECTGTRAGFLIAKSDCYLTAEATDFQRYSVVQELYEFGRDVLRDGAWPAYEFTIDSANFLYASEFKPFRDRLALGRGVHLDIGGTNRTAALVGLTLTPGEPDSFQMTFSNRYRLNNGAETLASEITHASSAGQKFESAKHLYRQTVGKAGAAEAFMNASLEAARNSVIGAANQSVVIDGAGIHIGTKDSQHKMRIVDNMIAMTDDGWQHAKMAIGYFKTEFGNYWGVNAEVIGGRLIVGNQLIIENKTDDGNMLFRVDATGAWLQNADLILQGDGSSGHTGKIMIGPEHGIAAGGNGLFTLNGTTITPSFIDAGGALILENGMPKGTNFYLDMDGKAYFSGTVKAGSGDIGGWTLSENSLSSGDGASHVELNSSMAENSLYAVWAGASAPAEAPFWIKRDGEVHAAKGSFGGTLNAAHGTFSGTLKAAKIEGDLTGNGGWLGGCGIKVGENAAAPNGYNFYVDQSGKVSITGGSISFDSFDPETHNRFSDIEDAASGALSTAQDAYTDLLKLANGQVVNKTTTFINGTNIYSPNIIGKDIRALSSFRIGQAGSEYGFMGPAQGLEVGKNGIDKVTTNGVALAASGCVTSSIGENSDVIDCNKSTASYLIVTNGGVRMQYGENHLFVCSSGIGFKSGSKSGWLHNMGTGSSVAVFG